MLFTIGLKSLNFFDLYPTMSLIFYNLSFREKDPHALHLPAVKAWFEHEFGWFLSQPKFPHFAHLNKSELHDPTRPISFPGHIIFFSLENVFIDYSL